MLVSNILDTGIRPGAAAPDPALNKLADDLWKRWAPRADADGHTDFHGLTVLAVREIIEGGEVFALRRRRRASDRPAAPMQIQLNEADHLDCAKFGNRSDGGRIVQGIEYDALGRRRGYWMFPDHPGDAMPVFGRRFESLCVGADGVGHLFECQRVQNRGVPWGDVVEYDEELVVTPGAVRMGRLNAGAPFLDSHRSWGLESVVGAVLPGTARIEGGQGFARVRLTSAPDAAPIVQRIMDGTVSAVSVGYRVHRYDITRAKGQRELWRAVDWKPMEISAVAMPANPGKHIRSTDPRPETLTPCLLTRADAPAPSPNQTRTTMPEAQTPEAEAAVETRAAPITPPADPSPDTIRTEANRVAAEVLALCERHALGAGVVADLIRRGLSLDAARAAILDKLAEADAPAASWIGTRRRHRPRHLHGRCRLSRRHVRGAAAPSQPRPGAADRSCQRVPRPDPPRTGPPCA
jgi:HK97 family phage prohead protease